MGIFCLVGLVGIEVVVDLFVWIEIVVDFVGYLGWLDCFGNVEVGFVFEIDEDCFIFGDFCIVDYDYWFYWFGGVDCSNYVDYVIG